jgi:hypothetical protein
MGVSAQVRVTLKNGCFHEDIGYGQMNGRKRGECMEKAKKEAVTDVRSFLTFGILFCVTAIVIMRRSPWRDSDCNNVSHVPIRVCFDQATKRCLRLFGNKLGGSVYDKEHCEDMARQRATAEREAAKKRTAAATAANSTRPAADGSKVTMPSVPAAGPAVRAASAPAPPHAAVPLATSSSSSVSSSSSASTSSSAAASMHAATGVNATVNAYNATRPPPTGVSTSSASSATSPSSLAAPVAQTMVPPPQARQSIPISGQHPIVPSGPGAQPSMPTVAVVNPSAGSPLAATVANVAAASPFGTKVFNGHEHTSTNRALDTGSAIAMSVFVAATPSPVAIPPIPAHAVTPTHPANAFPVQGSTAPSHAPAFRPNVIAVTPVGGGAAPLHRTPVTHGQAHRPTAGFSAPPLLAEHGISAEDLQALADDQDNDETAAKKRKL